LAAAALSTPSNKQRREAAVRICAMYAILYCCCANEQLKQYIQSSAS
jgi:hypothetical protein